MEIKRSSGSAKAVSGGSIHQKLVDYAVTRLKEMNIKRILYEVDTGSGMRVDVLGIKDEKGIAVECYVQVQMVKIRPRISKLNVDQLIFCVPNKPEALKIKKELDNEVWELGLPVYSEYTILRITRGTAEKLKALKRGQETYEEVINKLIEKEVALRRALLSTVHNI